MDQRDLARGALKATGMVKKGAQIKYGAIAMVVLLVGLIVLGAFFPAGKAQAASCEDAGPGTGGASPISTDTAAALGTLRASQIENAKKIDAVAIKHRLPGRATLIALMTAMQESTLQNLTYGHLDSLGLFQQRASMGWGTPLQITSPPYAAESFFMGRGTNPGLVDIAGWETMPLGDAAQKVQKSGFPTLYAGHESAMRALAKEAGINVERGGSPTGDADTTSGAPVTSENRCEITKPAAGSNAGGTFTDGTATWQLNNPRSVRDAIAWAKDHSGAGSSDKWQAMCLAFTSIVYGWNQSGVNYAIDHYTVVPASMRHDGDRNPPPGALMYWTTGHRAGHIAVYVGDGKVASNDILRVGYIDVVDAGLIESKWGAKYVGWTPPYFPRAG